MPRAFPYVVLAVVAAVASAFGYRVLQDDWQRQASAEVLRSGNDRVSVEGANDTMRHRSPE